MRRQHLSKRPEESERVNHRDTWGGIQAEGKANVEARVENLPNILTTQEDTVAGTE